MKWIVTPLLFVLAGDSAGQTHSGASARPELVTPNAHTLAVEDIVISRDDKWFATCSGIGGGVLIWDLEARTHLRTLRTRSGCNRMRLSPSDRVLAVEILFAIEFWDVRDDTEREWKQLATANPGVPNVELMLKTLRTMRGN